MQLMHHFTREVGTTYASFAACCFPSMSLTVLLAVTASH
jgi:hypothetical protein